MKRGLIILLLTTVFLFHRDLQSQDFPPTNPELVVSILSGQSIRFVFDEMDEYINGIMNAGHISFVRVLSIHDWQLQFKADQVMFYGTFDAANTMALNNVGVVVTSVGTNQDDGTHIINYAKDIPLALESADVLLLTKGSLSNKGGGLRNSFTFAWETGTMRGNMIPVTMLDQMLGADIYNLNVILTLSPVF